MIYIATVHWKDDRWIELQQRFLKTHVQAPYKVYAWLTGIPRVHYAKFDFVRDEGDPSHAEKLNILAQDILRDSTSDSDVLIFLDGDAFPIAHLDNWLLKQLAQYPLIAVQRLENLGDIQPHPCFCATTIDLWKRISGDWRPGHTWQLENGTMQTDVGGNLLALLEQQHIEWLKLHRSNTYHLDEVLFGVYADMVYHHGAGFRNEKGSRAVLSKAGQQAMLQRIDARILEHLVPKKYVIPLRFSRIHPLGRLRRRVFHALSNLSDEVYAGICADPDYVNRFIAPRHQAPASVGGTPADV